MTQTNNRNNDIIAKNVRLTYCHLAEPYSYDDSMTGKYSVSMLIKKTDSALLKQIGLAHKEAIQKGVDKYGQGFSKNVTPLIRPEGSNNGLLIDCDLDERYSDNADYKGCYLLSAKSTTAPYVFAFEKGKEKLNKEEILELVYSGCYGWVQFNFYPYQAPVNKGIACGLNTVIKMQDGDSMGGRANPTEMLNEAFSEAFGDLGSDVDPLA